MAAKAKISARIWAQTIESECVGARIRIINRKVTRMYDDALRPLGIKFSQMNILTFITVRGPIQAFKIAEGLSIEKSTVSRNLNILEENGWIDCLPGSNGNARNVKITRAGRELLKKAAPKWAEVQGKVKALLNETTVKALIEAEAHLRGNET